MDNVNFTAPRNPLLCLWLSAVEIYLRDKYPDLSLREVRSLPMMQGAWKQAAAAARGEFLSKPDDSASPVDRYAWQHQVIQLLAAGPFTYAAEGDAASKYNEYIAALQTTHDADGTRDFSTEDYGGFMICVMVWFYLASGVGTVSKGEQMLLDMAKDVFKNATPQEYTQDLAKIVDYLTNNHASQPSLQYRDASSYPGYGYFPLLDQLNGWATTGQLTSFFCLRTQDGKWQFLGMDTGQDDYNALEAFLQAAGDTIKEHVHLSHPKAHNWFTRLMVGIRNTPQPIDAINASEDEVYAEYAKQVGPFAPRLQSSELDWHKDRIQETDAMTILCSHHQLYSRHAKIDHNDPQYLNTHLLKDFQPCFKKKIAAWYWGHEHTYAIYQDGYMGVSKGRLLGRSSYEASQAADAPYQAAYPQVPYAKNMRQADQQNGFFEHACAVFDLKRDDSDDPINVTYHEFPSWGQNDRRACRCGARRAVCGEHLVRFHTQCRVLVGEQGHRYQYLPHRRRRRPGLERRRHLPGFQNPRIFQRPPAVITSRHGGILSAFVSNDGKNRIYTVEY